MYKFDSSKEGVKSFYDVYFDKEVNKRVLKQYIGYELIKVELFLEKKDNFNGINLCKSVQKDEKRQ